MISAGLRLGDTLCEGDPVRYTGRWSIPPERFAVVRCDDTGRRQFAKEIEPFAEEGVVQLLIDPTKSCLAAILAAVGELQFDVVTSRLASEYGAKTIISPLLYVSAHWVAGLAPALGDPKLRNGVKLAHDRDGRPVLLCGPLA